MGRPAVGPGNATGNGAGEARFSWSMSFRRGARSANRHQICSPHSAFPIFSEIPRAPAIPASSSLDEHSEDAAVAHSVSQCVQLKIQGALLGTKMFVFIAFG